MMSPRPAVKTMEFVPLDGGGTRLKHRLRAENRNGISLLWYRVTSVGALQARRPLAFGEAKGDHA
jgi:hypothetical protein